MLTMLEVSELLGSVVGIQINPGNRHHQTLHFLHHHSPPLQTPRLRPEFHWQGPGASKLLQDDDERIRSTKRRKLCGCMG